MPLTIDEQYSVISNLYGAFLTYKQDWEENKEKVYGGGTKNSPAHHQAIVAEMEPSMKRLIKDIASKCLKNIEAFRAMGVDKNEYFKECEDVERIAHALRKT